jgi:hypothetical protein
LPFFAAGVLPASSNVSGGNIPTTATIASTISDTIRVNVGALGEQDMGNTVTYEEQISVD